MCVLKRALDLHAYKSLDVYNYTLCWLELFPLGILNIFHPSLLWFAQFTAQLLIMSSHHLSLQYCLFSATCLYTHLKTAITEVLMIRRYKVVISFFTLFLSSPSMPLPHWLVISLQILQSVTIKSISCSHIFLVWFRKFLQHTLRLKVHYVALKG